MYAVAEGVLRFGYFQTRKIETNVTKNATPITDFVRESAILGGFQEGWALVGVSADRTNLSPFTKDFRALALVIRL